MLCKLRVPSRFPVPPVKGSQVAAEVKETLGQVSAALLPVRADNTTDLAGQWPDLINSIFIDSVIKPWLYKNLGNKVGDLGKVSRYPPCCFCNPKNAAYQEVFKPTDFELERKLQINCKGRYAPRSDKTTIFSESVTSPHSKEGLHRLSHS